MESPQVSLSPTPAALKFSTGLITKPTKSRKKDSWPKSKLCINCKAEKMFNSSDDYYRHLRECGQGKMLPCSMCMFTTPHKHHFVYHARTHYNSKPFKCKSCPYVSINKAMLTSHEKSHNSVHQFSCSGCKFSTKFLNALKKHCRQNGHQPAIPLNASGEPDTTILVDLNGSRRGKRKRPAPDGVNGTTFYPAEFNTSAPLLSPQNGLKSTSQARFENGSHRCNLCNCVFLASEILKFSKHLEEHVAVDSKRMESGELSYDSDSCSSSAETPSSPYQAKPGFQNNEEPSCTPSPLDLTKAAKIPRVSKVREIVDFSSLPQSRLPELKKPSMRPEMAVPQLERFKQIPMAMPRLLKPLPPLQPISTIEDVPEYHYQSLYLANYLRSLSFALYPFHCQICGNTFERRALFDFHMSFHSRHDPLMCNYCHEQTKDVVSFNEHMVQCQAFLKK